MPEEWIDVLDAAGHFTGETAPRSEVHRKGLFHRTVHIWITDGNGNILLQRRAKNKDIFPDMLDISCAGHLSAGNSSLEAALRELKEELGLTAMPEELKFLGTKESFTQGPSFTDREFNDIYLLHTQKRAEDLTLQKEEISDILFVSSDTFRKMTESKDSKLVRHSEEFTLLLSCL